MRILLAPLLVLPVFAACATEPDPSSGSALSAQTEPPTPAGPAIRSIAWTWHGCGPEANPLPFSMTVHVDVLSADDSYEIKGQALACAPFVGNDQLATCWASPAAAVRALTVTVADAHGSDTRTAPTSDCVDGKAEFLP